MNNEQWIRKAEELEAWGDALSVAGWPMGSDMREILKQIQRSNK